MYLIGTVTTGIAWMIFNFVMTYKIDLKVEAKREEAHTSHRWNDTGNADHDQFVLLDDDDIRWQAISVMVLPGMVWLMCCLRAWQFQYLISEAEQEAQDPIRSELEFVNVMSAATASGDNETEESQQQQHHHRQYQPVVNHEEELAIHMRGTPRPSCKYISVV
jgi:hypothetical protein